MVQESQSNKKFDQKQWMLQEHGKVLQYVSTNSLDFSKIIQKESAVLAPFVAIWLIESKTYSQGFWVISGDLPTDHIVGGNAKNAREAIKHFALRWQLKADNILNELGLEYDSKQASENDTNKEFANILISKAEELYQLADKEKFWVSN